MAEYNKKLKENGGATQSASTSSKSKNKSVKEMLTKKSKPHKAATSSPSKFKSKEFIDSSEDSSSDDDVSWFYGKLICLQQQLSIELLYSYSFAERTERFLNEVTAHSSWIVISNFAVKSQNKGRLRHDMPFIKA